QPTEQRQVGRREAVPDLLDPVELDAAPVGERSLGEPRRDADPQRTGDQLQQRPAAGRVERVEPRREMRADLGAAGALQGGNDLIQRRHTLTRRRASPSGTLSRGAGEGYAGVAVVPLS